MNNSRPINAMTAARKFDASKRALECDVARAECGFAEAESSLAAMYGASFDELKEQKIKLRALRDAYSGLCVALFHLCSLIHPRICMLLCA